MSTHTPKPWRYVESSDGMSGWVDSPTRPITGVVGLADGEDEANLRLCAASPDLLEACRAVAKIGDRGCCFDMCDGPDAPFVDMKTCIVCHAVQEARAAIAKYEANSAVTSQPST